MTDKKAILHKIIFYSQYCGRRYDRFFKQNNKVFAVKHNCQRQPISNKIHSLLLVNLDSSHSEANVRNIHETLLFLYAPCSPTVDSIITSILKFLLWIPPSKLCIFYDYILTLEKNYSEFQN